MAHLRTKVTNFLEPPPGGVRRPLLDGRLGDRPTLADRSPLMREFAEIWQAADKIVYSKTLEAVSTARTRIEREFDPKRSGR
jgi:hypothetical protein